MTLAEIATVSGKGGLFKVLAPTKAGVILESLDDAKTKMIATTNHRLSLLNEISIYTTTKEGTVALEEILKKIHKEFGTDLGVDGNSDSAELKSFLKSILPEYDEDRVYVSDIKKLVKWYEVIHKYIPELLTAKEESKAKEEPKKEKTEKSAETDQPKEVKEEKKPKAKKK
jgi:hypothetical protein